MYKLYNWRMLHPTADGGQAAAAAGGDDGQNAAAGADGSATEPEEEPAAGDGAKDDGDSVTLSKAELEKKLEQAAKRGARDVRKAKTAVEPDSGDGDDPLQLADQKLREANQYMLDATIKSLGSDKQITANGRAVAAKFLSLEDCIGANGKIDEDAVSDELDTFLETFPEFKKSEPQSPQYQYEGNPKGGGKKTMSKDEIMKIKDAAKRRRAIADNIHLFR